MISKYPGICIKCHKRFVIGKDKIIKDKKLDKWIHETCPDGHTYQSTINIPIAIDLNDIDIETPVEEKQVKEFIPTHYQQAIFDFITNGQGHAVVEAVAGSGKTTTIVKALDLTPKDAKVGFVAFNKHIATELKRRAPDHVHVSTLHSLGLSMIRKSNPKVQIEEDKVGLLLDDIWPVSKHALEMGLITREDRKTNWPKRLSMRKLVSICKSTLVDVLDANAVLAIIDRYNVEIDDGNIDEILEKLPDVMQKCKDETGIVDFDDMIWLPLVNNMELEKFDFLMVDEAQDMNVSQTRFILKSIKETGRIIAVGDRNQSLYGFRGADTEAIPNLIRELDATTLPLSITFRCPASHVELAKKLVPQLEARDNASEGSITQMQYFDLAKMVEPGDMVICRTNAPLIRPAFECIRMGKKAVIRGKDIGASLVNLIKRFETDDLGQFEVSLAEYFDYEYQKMLDKGKEMQALLLQDRVDTLRFIMNEVSTVSELMAKIMMLFADTNTGVIFSSVHRAKGLEAERVFILRPDLMPHPKAKQKWEQEQELNCCYVAQTRSKDALYFVNGGENV